MTGGAVLTAAWADGTTAGAGSAGTSPAGTGTSARPSGRRHRLPLPATLGTLPGGLVHGYTPGGLVHGYTPGGLTLLALAGLAMAVIGELGPATWAATSPATTALRAE